MLLVTIKLDYLLVIALIILLIGFSVLFYLKNKRNKDLFISQLIYKLMKEKMENVQFHKNKLYNLSFTKNNKNFFVKIYQGGKRKGFIMTNPTTIHEQTYSSEYGPSKKSEYAAKITPFLLEPLNGIKIILIKNNMLRITKYINENEIEEVKYNEPAFSTYIVQEKDLDNFLDLLKARKK